MSLQLIKSLLSKAAGATVLHILLVPWSLVGAPFRAESQPLPEYHNSQKVLISAELFEANYHAPELVAEIIKAGSAVLIVESYKNQVSRKTLGLSQRIKSLVVPHRYPWLRDFGPIVVRKGGQKIFLDLVYPVPEDTVHEGFPRSLGAGLGVPVKQVPYQLDGGNLLVAEETCVYSQTEKAQDGLRRILELEVGCKTQVPLVNPPHPHVDMYVKLLPGKVAVVSKIFAETRDHWQAYAGSLPEEFVDLGAKLEGVAHQLAPYFKVVRIPMPLPFRGGFRSYTNSAIVNQTVIVPSYRKFGWSEGDYPDRDLTGFYEQKVRDVYQSFGYKVSFVNSDALIYNGGSFHCVLLQIP